MGSGKSSCIGIERGLPFPLGATVDAGGVNFAVYSEHAKRMLLCLFDAADGIGERICSLPGKTGNVWHGYVPGTGAGQRYGFRAEGRFDPWAGDWFNPAKLLIDPYAKSLSGTVDWNGPVYGYRRDDDFDLAVSDMHDSGGSVPYSLVVDSAFDWQGDRRPHIPLAETVIYETHVKGLTARHPELPPELRGTYAGVAHPAVLAHLAGLGVTSIQLQPVQAFVDDDFLGRENLRNYWGYNPIGLFAPEGRYSSAGDGGPEVDEFKTMVRELHRHGFEVILDVVFNHTAESGREGPTLSFRGLDNRTYYLLDSHDASRYTNNSGTGNSLNTDHPAVLRLVLDSLRHWAGEYRVDGFRFDLATSLGREDGGFSPRSRLFAAMHQDPLLAGVKLIAEPWDVGHGGYQLGHFPSEWSEWNDRFRDSSRAFWLGHPARIGDFALRMAGSPDLFDRSGRGPHASVNFVTCHDGFTLSDLVSYNHKHNEANAEANGDGHNHNLSNNFGVEGPATDPAIAERRARARRNLLATMILAAGLPMVLGGDELSRTQLGNNNAYPQDNEVTWYDWSLSASEQNFLNFSILAIGLRKRFPVLRREIFSGVESPVPQIPGEARWRDASGRPMNLHDWERGSPRTLQLLKMPAGHEHGDPAPTPLAMMFNGDPVDCEFQLPSDVPQEIDHWTIELDTSKPDGRPARNRTFGLGEMIQLPAESLLVLSGESRPGNDRS